MPLTASYELCRRLHRRHGRTYYLATRLLPAWKRRHVHALYGFARYADEIVDAMDGTTAAERAARLDAWSDRFLAGLAGVPVDDPILPAVLHTVEVFGLDRTDFAAFLRSMTMDLTVTAYPTYADLLDYMDGSAAVIGTMMLPILQAERARPRTADAAGTVSAAGACEFVGPGAAGARDTGAGSGAVGARDTGAAPGAAGAAREPARQLGLAFQLTNFIRDIPEDLDRGRIYLPLADLARFGVRPADLRAGRPTGVVRDLVAFEVARARSHYARAAPGIPMLAPSSQACIRAAYRLYGGILDEIVRAGYDVFARRATVPTGKRLAMAAGCLLTRPGRPVPIPALTTQRYDADDRILSAWRDG